jgi:hypothetical protein
MVIKTKCIDPEELVALVPALVRVLIQFLVPAVAIVLAPVLVDALVSFFLPLSAKAPNFGESASTFSPLTAYLHMDYAVDDLYRVFYRPSSRSGAH